MDGVVAGPGGEKSRRVMDCQGRPGDPYRVPCSVLTLRLRPRARRATTQMPSKLTEEQSRQVRAALDRQLTDFTGGPRQAARGEGVNRSDFNAYPALFPARVVLTADLLPDEHLLAAIRAAMALIGDCSAYFLAREYAQGNENWGLDWEIPREQLTAETITQVSPGFEGYLYSGVDAWAVYFHHEGFAFCGGVTEFVQIVRAHGTLHPLDSV
jgi:hypothetical protein